MRPTARRTFATGRFDGLSAEEDCMRLRAGRRRGRGGGRGRPRRGQAKVARQRRRRFPIAGQRSSRRRERSPASRTRADQPNRRWRCGRRMMTRTTRAMRKIDGKAERPRLFGARRPIDGFGHFSPLRRIARTEIRKNCTAVELFGPHYSQLGIMEMCQKFSSRCAGSDRRRKICWPCRRKCNRSSGLRFFRLRSAKCTRQQNR